MDLIQRPKKVERSQKNYLTNEKYQDYAEKQFKTIYDYLDPKDFLNEIVFNESYMNCHAKTRAGIVFLDYNGELKAHGTDTLLFTIPEEYRPEGSIFISFGQGTVYGKVWINGETGEVKLNGISSTTTSARVNFAVSYLKK